nr:MAG TPA: Major capsid protein [Microviridae sp.]
MVKSVLQKPHSTAHLSRNAFDVGYTNKFTSSLGLLLPCYVRECNPNEHYRINPRMFCRSMPMNSAAFIQCTQNIEFYFVPYRLLWTSFPQWFVGTKYPVTTKTPSPEKESFPTFDLGLIFNNLTGSSVFGETDVLGYDLKKGALRLLDMLGYGDLSHFNDITSVNIETLKVSPFRLLAYQKVCSDFYRVANYEASRITSYNIDSPLFPTTSFLNFVKAYLQLRYRPWKKDRYTISSTSFQGADYMSSTINSPGFPSVDWSNNLKSYSDKDSYTGNLGALALSTTGNIGFSVANLRSAFALDKLYRLSAAAGDGDYKSQIKARYGFDPYAPQYKSEFIGSASAPVQVNPITTTADTLDSAGDNGTPAGRIYGNGIAQSSGDVFEYDVKEHGIIIGISSFVPDVDYSSYGINPFNMKVNREDYFQPEFDNLGHQPLTSLCFNPWKKVDVGESASRLQLVNTVLGWFPRYIEYKTCVDEVHGQLNGWLNRSFDRAPTLSLWTAPRFNSSDSKKFDNWRDNGLSLDFFYIDPSVYDSVFVNQYKGDQSQDQFICEVNNNVQAILPMSITGDPLI